MGIDEYLTVLRRHWRVVVAAMAIGIVAAWVTTTVAPPQPQGVSYTATAVILNTGSFASDQPGSGVTSLDTVATLATLDPVTERVAKAIGFEGDPRSLATQVEAAPDRNSAGIVHITASSDDPREATQLADTFATELIAYLYSDQQGAAQQRLDRVNEALVRVSNEIASIDERLATASPTQASALTARQAGLTNSVSFLSGLYQQFLRESLEPPAFELVERAAAVPVRSTGYEPPRSRSARVLLGAIVGLVGGFLISLLLHRFDKRIRTAEGAEKAFGAPVVAEIPHISRHDRDGIVIVEHPQSPPSEALRLLAAGVVQGPLPTSANGGRRRDARRDERRSKMVLVTSAAPGEGKTTLVANLAIALGETGRRVLVLSCDFRRPLIHEVLEVPNTRGLTELLKDPPPGPILSDFVVETRFDGVSIVPSGMSAHRPGEILGSGGMPRVMREARTRAEVVLVDTAPILAASDAAHLIPETDLILLVARAGVVTTSLARRTHEILQRLQSPTVGVVLNGAMETATPPGYREYFRAIPEQEDVGDSPPYQVTRGKASV